MHRLAHKCVTLQFLLDVYKEVITPIDENMTVKQVVEAIIKPFTLGIGCSFIDKVMPNMYLAPHVFVSHAFDNPISVVVRNLAEHFEGANFDEVYIWMDILVINQHNPGADLHEGRTLEATIRASSSVLVALDKDAYPFTRLWCLYEIGSTPIEKLDLLYPTSRFGSDGVVGVYEKIDTVSAKCFNEADAVMIRSHIHAKMLKQRVVADSASVEDSLRAFSRVLKLLLILRPTHYSIDVTDLLARVPDRTSYRLDRVLDLCTGGRLVCIAGDFGEGKSTIAAALVERGGLDAYHFCVKADANRQDKGLIFRSLAYQLAMKHKAFEQAMLEMSPGEVRSLGLVGNAWKHLIENPLRKANMSQLTILVDALDESDDDKGVNLIPTLVEMHRISKDARYLNVIVTTRRYEELLKPLQDCWQHDYIQLSPPEVRGDIVVQGGEANEHDTSLMKTLMQYIRKTFPNTPERPHDTVASAYSQIFGPICKSEQHRIVLEVLLAAYEPLYLSDWRAIDLLESARDMPGYGYLFLEREHKLKLLHRSIAEWLLEQKEHHIDVKNGHIRMADRKERISKGYWSKYGDGHNRQAGRFSVLEALEQVRIDKKYW